ncbi:aldose epimerase family protein [Vibrio mediterranei]
MIYVNKNDCVELEANNQFLRIALNGSISSWICEGKERIYTSVLADITKRFRGGTPLCFPYFGGAKVEGMPPHGTYQDSFASLEKVEFLNGELIALFNWNCEDDFDVKMKLTIGKDNTVTVEHSVKNCSIARSMFGIGVHPYFTVNSEHALAANGSQTINVTPPYDERHKIEDGKIILGEIGLDISGYTNISVWKISHEQSTKIDDMKDDDYKKFVCISPFTSDVTVNPQESLNFKFKMKIRN